MWIGKTNCTRPKQTIDFLVKIITLAPQRLLPAVLTVNHKIFPWSMISCDTPHPFYTYLPILHYAMICNRIKIRHICYVIDAFDDVHYRHLRL